MNIQHFFDDATNTLTYVVHKTGNNKAIVFDPVWDIDVPTGRLSESSLNKVVDYLETKKLEPVMVLETHAHADHLSGAQILKRRYPEIRVAISARITAVQATFGAVFNASEQVLADGRQFDYLFKDFEELDAAGMRLKVIPTPGHTPACSSYLIEDAVFVGDALFMPDYGTGRCDFPGGSALALFKSIKENLYSLPDHTRVLVGHDYQPGGRPLRFESTIGEQKASNIHLDQTKTEAQFVSFRESRDQTLNTPRLLYPSLQVNIRAGHLPEGEGNGMHYLKIPLQLIH